MEDEFELTNGTLVTVATGGPPIDAIVMSVPSPAKVVVALVDPKKGPVLQTVARDAVTEREAEGKHDPALKALIRRNMHAHQGGLHAGGTVQQRAGFSKPTGHRKVGGGS